MCTQANQRKLLVQSTSSNCRSHTNAIYDNYNNFIEKLIRKNSPNDVILAMKSTEKQALSFQETTQLQPNSNH